MGHSTGGQPKYLSRSLVGAALTQNTAWRNVELAIANLADGHALEPELMMTIPEEDLAELIRPAGYFHIKAKRLRTFCAFFHEHGQRMGLSSLPTASLRTKLLRVHGVGPETADSILLYACASLFNEYHALIVEHAKHHCRAKPVCPGYPLLNYLPHRVCYYSAFKIHSVKILTIFHHAKSKLE